MWADANRRPPIIRRESTSLFSLLGFGFQGLFLFDMVVVLSNLLSLAKIIDNYCFNSTDGALSK